MRSTTFPGDGCAENAPQHFLESVSTKIAQPNARPRGIAQVLVQPHLLQNRYCRSDQADPKSESQSTIREFIKNNKGDNHICNDRDISKHNYKDNDVNQIGLLEAVGAPIKTVN